MIEADLLKGLCEREAERVLALGRRVVLTTGAELFHLGDQADCIYVVARGRIRLTLPMQVRSRDEDVMVEERSTGQTVGWSALIPPYRFTLTASAPLETEVIALPREALNEYFAAHPDTGYAVSLNLSSVIGQRLQLFQAMWLREIQRMVELRCA
ncbi:MAG TPA: cyclic nucleotide-binding domain-containing protein [Verrucomicrobiae bacterium]|nr:cyclic nucleotide-binding domain-containing protein [Verrucomicrobiae bacterium]